MPMKLAHLLEGLKDYDLVGDPGQEIDGIAYDSRQVKPGYLFVAIKGHALDGHDYLKDAVENGATALAGQTFEGFSGECAMIRVPDSRKALWKLGNQFYGRPYEGLNLIGITGTNGKTSTSYILESILSAAGATPGVIGTVNYRYWGKTYSGSTTTPESLDLMRYLRDMADGGVTDVVLEVSSIALDQNRTGDCPFRVAIFTNFSRDHLDYHRSMEEYFKAKILLFRSLAKSNGAHQASAVINTDDPRGEELISLIHARVITYGLGQECHVRADTVTTDLKGLKATLITPEGEVPIRSRLIGEVNIYNILAATAAALALNIDPDKVVEGIEGSNVVPGRLELVKNNRGLNLMVDYAHTPDALLKTLKTLRPLVQGRVITVFGCGGDRDKGKRHEMGWVAGKNSDLVLITSDNPRSEEPLSIIEQIERGTQESGLVRLDAFEKGLFAESGYLLEADRREAIRKAVSMAREEDLVLIAGKGHEDYQIIGSERRTFDDRKEAALAASQRG
jgi:UDP-N-acetylmuramoyl-L-alanyl-D-glutamate--2,6-diaminopimelate ligase